MATQGPNYAGTAADDATLGAVAWTDPTNAQGADDSTFATSNLNINATHYLKCTNFGFSIPGNATIDGIQVEFNVKRSGLASHTVVDNSVKIVKGGTISGDEKADGITDWTTTANWRSKGGATDLWGLTWTADDINASTFGAALSGINDGVPTSVASCDACRITVTFTSDSGFGISTTSAVIL